MSACMSELKPKTDANGPRAAMMAPPGTPGPATMQTAKSSMKWMKSGKSWGIPDEDEDVEDDDNKDYLREDKQDVVSLPRIGHAREDAEDVKREQRDDNLRYDERDDVLKLVEDIVQRGRIGVDYP